MAQREADFRSLFFELTRLAVIGGRFNDDGYGAYLDSFVEQLDHMSERRVVPGRVFAPSTIRGRDELFLPFIVMLISKTPPESDEKLVARLGEIIAAEKRLPQGDRSLVDLLNFFEGLTKAIEGGGDRVQRVVNQLHPTETYRPEVAERLRNIFGLAIAAINEHRATEIKKLPIDTEVLKSLCVAAEGAATTPPANIGVFYGFGIEKSNGRPSRPIVERPVVRGLPRGMFTKPQREELTSDWIDRISNYVTAILARFVWQSFWDRERKALHIDTGPEKKNFGML